MVAVEEPSGYYETEYIWCCENYASCNGRYDNESEALMCCSVCSECGDPWDECGGSCEWCEKCASPDCENSPEGYADCYAKEAEK